MGKGYAVTYRGIDGTDTIRFKTLAEAAAYIKDRWLGTEYMRGESELQGEFGVYVMRGFGWSDLGKRVPADDGYPEFQFFVEFGGTFDPDLDPTAEGDYSICEVHPQWHPSFDYCTGVRYKPVARATTASLARRKLAKLNEKYADDELEFNPFALYFGDRQVHLDWCDGDPARQAEADLELDRRLKSPAPIPVPAPSLGASPSTDDDIPF